MYFSIYSPYKDTPEDINPSCFCIICLDELTGDTIMTFRTIAKQNNKNTNCLCNCYCHDSCMKSWIEKQNSCPICRKKMVVYNNINEKRIKQLRFIFTMFGYIKQIVHFILYFGFIYCIVEFKLYSNSYN